MAKAKPEPLEADEKIDFTHRSRCLETANQLITGDRNRQYGSPIADFAATAAMWSAYLGDRFGGEVALEPHDVAAMMVLLKVSRLRVSPGKEDHWIDIAGYAGCGMECALIESGQAHDSGVLSKGNS